MPFVGALLNAPGWGLAFLDRELRVVWVNDALSTLLGQPGAPHLHPPLGELWPALASALAPLCARALEGEAVTGVPVCGEFGRFPGGLTQHLRVSLLPAVTGGLLSGLTLVAQDETERVSEEQYLRESETRLKDLLELSCDGYVIHDGDRVLEVSHGFAATMGCRQEELMGASLMQWLAPESKATVLEAFRRALETPYELVVLRPDGQRLPLQVVVREVLYRGQRARMSALWDISARRAAEEAAARTENFREQLLGVVGHDLRTPLNTIQLGVVALQNEGKLEDEQARQVMHMASAARRMERMIRELLDFTRARLAGGIPVRPTLMSLERLIERALEEQRLAFPSRPFRHSYQGNLQGQWDEARLAQLLDNLLGNALQHSPEGTPVEIRAEGARDGIRLSVLNQGPPILPDERETLFEPFRRGKKARGDGLGLGLYIAQQIALAHGGNISVESSGENSTRFTVWLPRQAPHF